MTAEEMPLLQGKTLPLVPAAPFASALNGSALGSGKGDEAPRRPLPQTIAHRGYKAAFPENSMLAFEQAIAVGAHALETDVHLSKDGVVVLSHDKTLNRCFSLPDLVSSHDWPYLSTLRTTAPPHVPLARLSDLLSYLISSPSLSSSWILLDIKTDDDPLLLIPAIASTLSSIPPPPNFPPWSERVVLGGWNENWISHLRHFLPDYPIAYIGFSLLYARKFLDDTKYPNVGFNLLQQSLVGPIGTRFMKHIKGQKPCTNTQKEEEGDERKLFVWTVNDEHWMEWCCRKGEKGLIDGVITDDPKLFKEVCDRYYSPTPPGDGKLVKKTREGRTEEGVVGQVRRYVAAFGIQLLTLVLVVLWWRRLSTRGGPEKQKRTAGKVVPITS
ncbi:glycerophosphoryl diester phosphodiesterase [Podospora australis]|uniref:Glycerophosphoryl diester phosphodiesterase n=1 Tax=Podospora australis TaxID=1536484 RepID=A0AAN6X1M9_9PEZI|nr:glycerophosphoryl diester phosphodiesterase [Podospora australis]